MQSARFGRTIIATAISFLLATPAIAVAQEDSSGVEIVHSTEQTNIATVKLMTLQRAINSFYTANLRWPASLSELNTGTDIYFVGDFSTPFGDIVGVQNSANSYGLEISVPANPTDFRLAQYENLAGNVGGDYASNKVSLSIPLPYTASIVKNMLQTTEDTSGLGLNEMLTDLSLGNNDITNIKTLLTDNAEFTGELKSNAIQAVDASVDSLNSDTLTVSVEAQVGEAVSDSASFNVLTINDVFEANSLNFGTADLNELTATDQAVIENVTVSERATFDYLDADTVEFDYGSFTASLSAINAKASTLKSDTLQVDNFIGPVSFNSPTVVNNVTQIISAFTVNGPLLQQNGLADLGATEINANLVTGEALFSNDVTLSDSFTTKNANFYDTVNVEGRTSIDALVGTTATFSNNLLINGSANVTDQLQLSGDLIAGNKVIAQGGSWYENGQKVTDKYYGILDTVVDAEKLGGKDSSLLAVTARNNVFTKANTFSKNLYVNGSVKSAAGVLIDTSGRLYDKGVLVSSKYAKKSDLTSATAAVEKEISSVEANILAAVNQRQSQLNGYRSRINSVRSAQTKIDSTNNTTQSYLSTANSYLTTAQNNYNTSNTSLSGVKGKVSGIQSAANTISNMDAYKTTVVRHTHTVYKR